MDDLENDQPYIKFGIEGFAGGGKSYTATEIAIGLYKHRKLTEPILAYLTEPGLKRLKHKFVKAGIPVKFIQSTSLTDLREIMLAAESLKTILIIDSITHVWEHFVRDYMKQANRKRLQFQDWGVLKPKWAEEFNDIYVNTECDIFMCGRASYEYDYELIEGTKTLVKSGTKMSTEKNTAFEPDINIEMRLVKVSNEDGTTKEVFRECFVKKDRTDLIDGQLFKNPDYSYFKPAISMLLDGVSKIKQKAKPNLFDLEKQPDGSKKILLEKISSELQRMKLGTSKEDKAAKVEILKAIFETSSWTEIEKMRTKKLEPLASIVEQFADWYIDACNEAQANESEAPGIPDMKMKLLELCREERRGDV